MARFVEGIHMPQTFAPVIPDFSKLNGADITRRLTTELLASAAVLDRIRDRDDIPVEARARLVREEIARAEQISNAARQRMADWAHGARTAAVARRDAPRVGTAAEESARVASELRINRLASSLGGNAQRADEWAEQASQAYDRGDFNTAREYAEAVVTAFPGHALAREVVNLSQVRRWMEDPEAARAMQEITAIGPVVAVHSRDAQARLSQVLKAASRAASAVGLSDGEVNRLTASAARESINAKMEAYALAVSQGTDYVPPAGALESLPTGRDTTGRLASLPLKSDPRP